MEIRVYTYMILWTHEKYQSRCYPSSCLLYYKIRPIAAVHLRVLCSHCFGSYVKHRKVLLSITIIADNENEDTWGIFICFLADSLMLTWESIIIITDQNNGAQNDINIFLLGCKKLHYTMHRKKNVFNN